MSVAKMVAPPPSRYQRGGPGNQRKQDYPAHKIPKHIRGGNKTPGGSQVPNQSEKSWNQEKKLNLSTENG